MLHILNFRMLRAFWENFGENFRRERPKIVHSRSRKTRMKPSKTGNPLPKSQLDFESFSLRPLRYISKYIFIANLRFVYRKSALKLGTVAVRILLENASFRQVKKPARTSNSDVSSCEMEKCGEASTRISSRSRYDHFDTSPYCSLYSIAKKSPSVNTFLPGAGPGLQRRPGLFGGIFCEVQRFLQKRAGFFAVFEYNIEDIVQI